MRERILGAASDLFARRGFDGTSLQHVAQSAGVEHETVLRHFGDKTQLYADVVGLAGDRFHHAMHGHLEPGRATLSETFRDSVLALREGNLAALICASTTRRGDSAIAGLADSPKERLVDFWRQRLDVAGTPPECQGLAHRRVAELIVPVALAAASSDEPSALATAALFDDFAAALDRMASTSESRHRRGSGWQVRHAVRPATSHRPRNSDSGSAPLSPRELQVLREVEKGGANKDIARELDVTVQTVKYHLKSIFKKLSVVRRTEAVKVARELGLIER